MQEAFGVVFHFIRGFASSSFYFPYKRAKDWTWESYWIASCLIVPFLATNLNIPDSIGIIRPVTIVGYGNSL